MSGSIVEYSSHSAKGSVTFDRFSPFIFQMFQFSPQAYQEWKFSPPVSFILAR